MSSPAQLSYLYNHVRLSNMAQKLVPEPLAFGRSAHQPCNVPKLNRSRNDFRRVDGRRQGLQPLVRHAHKRIRGVDGTKGKVCCCRRRFADQGVEERRFAHVREAYDSCHQSHAGFRAMGACSSSSSCCCCGYTGPQATWAYRVFVLSSSSLFFLSFSHKLFGL